MTDTEINIAIAKACGWANCINPDQDEYHFLTTSELRSAMGRTVGRRLPTALHEAIPNYCNDLNAMREAEQKMWSIDWGLRHVFIYELAKLIDPINGYRMREGIDLLDATARQRADALLNAINHRENYG